MNLKEKEPKPAGLFSEAIVVALAALFANPNLVAGDVDGFVTDLRRAIAMKQPLRIDSDLRDGVQN